MSHWQRQHYTSTMISEAFAPPNLWDVVVLVLFFGMVALIAIFAKEVTTPYHLGDQISISLDPRYLPGYAIRTVFRMMIGLFASLIFTLIIGTLAAKNRYAEQLVIPIIDILQSVPVLGFQAIFVVPLIHLFPGSMIGPECAAIFVIFTAQAWNMVLSFYQSLKTIPLDIREAADMFHLSAWQRFWRIEVPFAIPGLLWNMMMSMSAGWFFVVATEAITVSKQSITLPGIGSYIATAIVSADSHAVIAAIVVMLVVIFGYDQLFFRPLVCWSEKFKPIQDTPTEAPQAWLITLFHRTRLLKKVDPLMAALGDFLLNRLPLFCTSKSKPIREDENKASVWFDWIWRLSIAGTSLAALIVFARFVHSNFSLHQISEVFWMGSLTTLRVLVLIVLCSLLWIPVGVWIGLRPKLAQAAQPVIQFLAAFPANLLFPVVVAWIVHFKLNTNIYLTPLMILGAQWYILFNVIAGAMALPKDLYLATANFGVKGWLWWRRFILPGIFPYFITGAITAAGGAWNASIVAEFVHWGQTYLEADGLGSYITRSTYYGSFSEVVLGIGVMCLYVLLLNKMLWQPLYKFATKRCQVMVDPKNWTVG